MQKRCPTCRTTKPHSEFHKVRGRADGIDSLCKVCKRAKMKARYEKNKQRDAKNIDSLFSQPVAQQEWNGELDITFVDEPAITEAPAAALVDPIESAYNARAVERAKRDLKKEHAALLAENETLRKERDVYLGLGSPEIIVYEKSKDERSDSVANAILSDWHVEETVEKHSVHGLNEYNPDIARVRAEWCFKNLLALTDVMARDTTIKTLHITLGGDFFSGWIHEELLATTAFAPADAARFAESLLASGIAFLLRESQYNLEIDCVPGNHGRLTKQVHIGDPTGTSLETFMYSSLANRFDQDQRVSFRVATQAMIYRRVYERFVARTIHGYEVKFGGGVGGITIPLNKKLDKWDNPIRADLTEVGHFHTFLDCGRAIINGSLIGYNLFAQTIGASFEEPRQAFYLIHARNGGQKSVVAPIWVDDAHKTDKPDLG